MSDVRAMLACLANDEVARVFAQIVLDGGPNDPLSPARRRKAAEALLRSGLIAQSGDEFTLHTAEIKAVLATASESGRRLVDPLSRWLDSQGRISQYPRRASDRAELLRSIGEQTIDAGVRVSEAELNVRLEKYTADTPTLRRYLIVHGVLAREPDGSLYWRS